MAAEDTAVEQAADELYGLPLDEFTRARDERAKELRKKSDREAADAVKALRKPTVAAGALNQLARTRRKDVERLLDAGGELQSAQEELLAGGDRAAFQRAAAKERELVAELAAGTEPGLAEKIAATLHAAALDPEVADELRAGRLVREHEAIGGFGASESGTEPTPRAKSKSKSKAKPKSKSKAKRSSSRSDEAARRERAAAARTDERHAKRELDAAAKALEHARSRAEAAKAHAAEANERAKTTAERLKEARRAESAARKAHERAARALQSAERA